MTPAPAGTTFVLDPAQSGYDPADPCGAPVSSTLVLDGATWRSEFRHRAECLGDLAGAKDPGAIVTIIRSGTLKVSGDTIQLHDSAVENPEYSVEDGTLTEDVLTIYGHCEGESVFIRKIT